MSKKVLIDEICDLVEHDQVAGFVLLGFLRSIRTELRTEEHLETLQGCVDVLPSLSTKQLQKLLITLTGD
jgi:hypothetical protein